MIVHQKGEFAEGYNAITAYEGPHADMQMDFGIIRLSAGTAYSNKEEKERAFLLIEGSVKLSWDGKEETVTRNSCFDENPICLHVPKGMEVRFTGMADNTEICCEAVHNDNVFEAKLYTQDMCVSDIFGKDELGNTSIRTVRTVIDDSIAPYSNLVIGEVINHPGKWSSYPPHHHVQPEVYHYRFLPETGFGVSIIGDQAEVIQHKSTSCVPGNLVHPQCSAPGYAMYYIWLIPHTKEKRWLKDRTFDEKHTWMLQPDAKIWEPK
ncbi:5-deoxy-glucuronate isomerase [Anaerotalea alkaliphila]|uniref:5-deoxy-glucuronate isomerase n=1 Tax=Anaerotalea alkaliphila TaxID=2662126 RepID=A0A7X5HW96_9FIRM|nr:5-deoxy-glucuronate isomerase [Anaerotalea alkaliphila]NDL67783.1 5-deoxy-glucuronate isomerase [Anaerotalea alkaliphila]